MNENTAFSSKGFTLIELLLVMGVTAILATYGIYSFVSYNKNQKLVQAQAEVATTVAEAKSRAQSQIKPTGCLAVLNGYRFTIVNQSTYKVAAVCGGVENSGGSIQKTLPSDIIISSTPSSFLYEVLTGRVIEAADSGTDIIISQGSTQKKVTIYKDGRYVAN